MKKKSEPSRGTPREGQRASRPWITKAEAMRLLDIGEIGLGRLIESGRITVRNLPTNHRLLLADVEKISASAIRPATS